MASDMGPSIEVTHVTKKFERNQQEDLVALDDVTVTFEAGAFTAVLGPSGCGKSTLLRLVAGLIKPTTGELRVAGKKVDGPYKGCGIVFQQDLLLDWRTSLENVLLPVEMGGLRRKEHLKNALELLELVGLQGFESALPEELSGGMRQRVAIARALLMGHGLILMDEPFGALDALTRDQMALDLQPLVDRGETVLFITHSIDEAVFLADRVIVLSPRPGRIHSDIRIDLPRPRRLALKGSERFDELTTQVREIFLEQGVLHEDHIEVKSSNDVD